MIRPSLKSLVALALLLITVPTTYAQYQDYARMGKTPAELMFIDDPMKIDLKEPSWFWHVPKMDTAKEQLAYAIHLEQDGDLDEAVEAYDDLVHEWHATEEALRAQLSIARIESARNNTRAAYDADIYLLAHFSGRFGLEPVLKDAVAQADLIAHGEAGKTLRTHSGKALRQNYERIIHFAPRWKRVPELLHKIAQLYISDEAYDSAITVCDKIAVDWPNYEKRDRLVYTYCYACRKQADVWANDVGRLQQLERLIAGARTFYPEHPDNALFETWGREIYVMRRDRAYQQTAFYDNPQAYAVEAARLTYEAFLRDFPDAPQAATVRARLDQLKAAPAPAAE